MKLNFEQIKAITQGAERILCEDGEFSFLRFTEAEDEAYSKSELYPRTFSTSGIKLHFKTDADSILLKVRTEKLTNLSIFAFDVYANKNYLGSIKNYPCNIPPTGYSENEYPVGSFEGEFELPHGENEIEVYFPWSLKGVLTSLELKGASFLTAVKRDKTLLVYGDSIAQGTAAQNPSRVHVVRLADYLGAELHSKAIGSEVYFPELAEIKSESYSPDVIYVSYGANDWYTLTYEDAEARCLRFWENICKNYPDAEKICISPIWYRNHNVERPFGPLSDVELLQRRVTSQFKGITFVRGWEIIPQEGEYLEDGIHPNNDGFDIFYDSLKALFPKNES